MNCVHKIALHFHMQPHLHAQTHASVICTHETVTLYHNIVCTLASHPFLNPHATIIMPPMYLPPSGYYRVLSGIDVVAGLQGKIHFPTRVLVVFGLVGYLPRCRHPLVGRQFSLNGACRCCDHGVHDAANRLSL